MVRREWVVAYVTGGREKTFHNWMNERGIQCYVPMGKRKTKPSRKKQAVVSERAAFPGYAFVNIKVGPRHNREWGVMREAPGFIRVVTHDGGQPICVRESVIAFLEVCQKKGDFDYQPLNLRFVPGSKIEVKDGVFVGMKGQVLSDPDEAGDYPVVEFGPHKVKIHVSLLEFSGQSPHPGRAG